MNELDFIKEYEDALATQQWARVDPLIHPNACVTFSDGSFHQGKAAVKAAFERNFEAIADETYRIENVHWLLETDDMRVYTFEFHWTGQMKGQPVSGAGRGTSVLVSSAGDWKLLTEHLGSVSK